MRFTKHKAIVAAVGAVVTVLTAAFADDVFGMDDVTRSITVLIEQGALVWAVFQVRNKPVASTSADRY